MELPRRRSRHWAADRSARYFVPLDSGKFICPKIGDLSAVREGSAPCLLPFLRVIRGRSIRVIRVVLWFCCCLWLVAGSWQLVAFLLPFHLLQQRTQRWTL
jgi:hypothetical protein